MVCQEVSLEDILHPVVLVIQPGGVSSSFLADFSVTYALFFVTVTSTPRRVCAPRALSDPSTSRVHSLGRRLKPARHKDHHHLDILDAPLDLCCNGQKHIARTRSNDKSNFQF